jgi:threonine dehydrogenase-like Zn-dependent dehydrogenase
MKELDIRFSFAYDLSEFTGALGLMADGAVDVGPLITGTAPLESISQAFADLSTPQAHCKVLIEP